MPNGKPGSILVLGGGIGGIQAALDLAESGFKVYMVENKYSIGGVMAQLDKTFPTNDCSICILSPKLVECGRHENIELLTGSEVIGFEGEAGDFKVKILEHPRYIRLDKCTGCGDCAKACPVDNRPNIFEELLIKRTAAYRLFDQAAPSAFVIEKLGEPPCRARCPLHVNAVGYIQLIKIGKYEEALALVREKNPFPAITGRICTHPCESVCDRARFDEPVAIDYLKRFVADYELKKYGSFQWDLTKDEPKGKSVGIVGAGPAGLMCAHDLLRKGYDVTIYDALDKPGGMMYAGIPSYRLPRDILFGEIELIEKLGGKFVLNTVIGKDIKLSELREKHDAVFIAIGAHKSRKLRVPGEDLEGVWGAVEFLREFNLGKDVKVGKKAMVIGGGNAAIDAARTLLRLGADVTILYRRSRKEMPANPEEVEEAIEEGVKIEFLVTPVEILGENGKVTGIKCVRMKLGEPDESGRRRPIPIEGSEFVLECDMVVPAISQQPDLSLLGEEIEQFKITRWNTFEVDEKTLATNVEGVFAGGDDVTGPLTYIDAMAQGRKAAISIDRYLQGIDLYEGRDFSLEGPIDDYVQSDQDPEDVPYQPRAKMKLACATDRAKNFEEVALGFDEETAVAEAKRCLSCAGCSECMECVRACKADAIDHSMLAKIHEVRVGSVILAPGFDEFIPTIKSEYGYGRFKNVVTSIQFERILSASGPYKGHIKRPGDGKHPRKIAWIQCVGSRDEQVGRPYCSSVCCMYATKEAVIAKEHAPDVEPTIFFMDMRSYGKEFDKYIERAEKEIGVRFIRSRVAKIDEDPETGNLWIKYETEDGKLEREEFEMVVLSVGFEPSVTAKKLAETFGIELDEFGFAKTAPFRPMETSRDGVYVIGAFAAPKDIPETVAQASGGAALASSVIADARGTEITERELPPEIDVKGQPPRIGVFVCHCGINIAGVVDVKAVVEYAKTLPNVVYAEDNLYTCSQDTQERIKEKIKEYKLNRVVVASCTPRTHEPLFQQTIREAGLNKFLFNMANIRDQDSWVHRDSPQDATEKAKDLVRMAVAKATLLEPLQIEQIPVTKRALIIGGGIAGMEAAVLMGKQGFETYLIERSEKLGGNALYLRHPIEGIPGNPTVAEHIESLTKELEKLDNVKVYLSTEIEDIEGYVGNYKTTIKTPDGRETLEHGVVIVTTGAKQYEPKQGEYGWGMSEKVITMRDLDMKLAEGEIKVEDGETFAFIQCVGSRNDEHPYCSRVCCTKAVEEAVYIKSKNPKARVVVFYRDIRTYGYAELIYRKAREMGTLFIRFDPEKPPEVTIGDDGKPKIKAWDILLGAYFEMPFDWVVLNAGIVPDRENNEKLSKMLKVPLTADGFFLEAHMKLRPVDFATDGVFLAGLAHSPKNVEESIAQAQAAVSRACTILSKDYVEAAGTTAEVNEFTCVGCGTCVSVCAYSAIELVEKKVMGKVKVVASVNPALCKGCGACAAACRSNSIDLKGFTNDEVVEEVEAISWEVF